MSANIERRSGTLERGLALLEFFAMAGAATPVEAEQATGLSRSATYRLIGQLRTRGYLEAVPSTDTYRLGVKAVEVGLAAVAGLEVVSLAAPYLRELAHAAGETAFLAILDGDDMVYLSKEDGGTHAVQLKARLGTRRPIHATGLGKAFLSAMPMHELDGLLSRLRFDRFTPHTITEPTTLREDILDVRARGYAIDNIENEDGVACFAAPVMDYSRQPVCAISVAGPAERILPTEQKTAQLVVETAQAISRRLGYRA